MKHLHTRVEEGWREPYAHIAPLPRRRAELLLPWKQKLLEHIPFRWNRDVLSIHAWRISFVGEPASTSPGYALVSRGNPEALASHASTQAAGRSDRQSAS